MIAVDDLTKCYGEKTVFDRFSAQIADGICTVITGGSGCGKTTLLRLIAGLEQPDVGEITGVPGKISAAFQENRLCNDYTALSNVCMVTDRVSAKKMLSRMGLADSMKKPVRELSGGMQRRVAIARALCADCELLLLDEPFQGLDPATKETVMRITKEESAGKTVLLVTHDPAEAAYFSGEALRL